MRKYLSGLDIKKKIIQALKEKPTSLRKLETSINVGYKTLKLHCKELQFLGILKLTKIAENSRNGRPYTIVILTDYGRSL